MSMPRQGRYVQLILAIALAVVFLYLAFGKLDWAQFWKTIAQVRFGWLMLACLVLVADFSIRTSRWWVMLRKTRPDVPLRACFTPFMSCLALNNVLPFRAGDAVRVIAFRDRLGVASSTLLATLVAERVLDLGCLLILLTAGLPLLAQNTISAEWRTTMHVLSIFLVAGCVVTIAANRPIRRLLQSLLATPFAQCHPLLRQIGRAHV